MSQMIWKRAIDLTRLNQSSERTLIAHLGIEYCEIGDDYLKASMPVAEITHQPLGMLHGGASVVLAETLGSVAANYAVAEGYYCVGLEVNANHLRAKRNGQVFGTATPVHLGQRTQVWQIDIVDERGRTICLSRLTMAVLKQKRPTKGQQHDL